MSDAASWLEGNFATLVLAVVTAILAYVTYTLKRATDHLGQLSILPRLVFDEHANLRNAPEFPMRFTLTNKGVGTAFATRLFITTPQGVEFPVNELHGDLPLGDRNIEPSQGIIFQVKGMAAGLRFKGRATYQDAEGHQRELRFDFITPTAQAG